MARRGAKVIRRFAKPQLSAEAWWERVEPLLSPQAQQDYYGVDPKRVPITRVTGKPTLVRLDTALAAIVQVPTDGGLYAVTLSRSPQAPDWVAERIAAPEPGPHAQQFDAEEG